MKAAIITAGSVCAALVAIFSAYHQLTPTEAKIVTNGVLEARIEPVEREVDDVERQVVLNGDNMNYLKGNFATRNISWLHEKLCQNAVRPSVRRMYFDELEDEFAVYEQATGRKHRYELMGYVNVCQNEY